MPEAECTGGASVDDAVQDVYFAALLAGTASRRLAY